ncbi:MAG TPA: Rrf2 family transcriptional regulator [Ignavibacteria bacterium]|jgi:Rrf2 family protein
MKFSSQEEYGLRCLLRIARDANGKGLTIPEISKAEGMTTHNAAKLLRILRLGGFLASSRGQIGGYTLSRPAEEILLKDVLDFLGGKLYDTEFCDHHKGTVDICTHSIDCSIRSLWQTLQNTVDSVLNKISIKDLLSSEDNLVSKISINNKETISL